MTANGKGEGMGMPERVWRWLTTGRHERWLEGEVARLRAERDECRRQNWALINSLVTTAGAPLPQEILRRAQSAATESPKVAGQPVIRGKKTWHQRAMALEIESRRELRDFLRERAATPAEKKIAGPGAPGAPKGE